MTAQMATYGRLGNDPRSIDTKSGKPMAVASVAVDVGDSSDEDAAPEWFGVVAFGGLAERLLQHGKGECISVSGRLQRRTYQDRSGEQRSQLQVVADNLVSARTARPSGGKGEAKGEDTSAGANREAYGGRATEPAGGGDFDDELPPF